MSSQCVSMYLPSCPKRVGDQCYGNRSSFESCRESERELCRKTKCWIPDGECATCDEYASGGCATAMLPSRSPLPGDSVSTTDSGE